MQMHFDAMKFFAFLKAMIYPERNSKPFSQYNVIHIATYVSLTRLFWSGKCIELCKVNCLILLIMNEIYLNAQIIPIVVFHSAIPPSVGQAAPQNTRRTLLIQKNKSNCSRAAKGSSVLIYGIGNFAFTTCFGIVYFKMFY